VLATALILLGVYGLTRSWPWKMPPIRVWLKEIIIGVIGKAEAR
jgi:hypothetical protein